MTGKDHARSVRARLLERARREGDDFQRLLVRFAIERLLYRLSASDHSADFVLKGATLFTLWMGKPHRATKDLDLLGRGNPDLDRLVAVFRDIASVTCLEDGMLFDVEGVTGAHIRMEAVYAGVRVVVPCDLAGARFKVQVDIGFGDAVVPSPHVVEFGSLLDLPRPRIQAYAPESVVAEKLEALVVLGITTSRMKDLYDLDWIRRSFAFDEALVAAVAATFLRRGTPIPSSLPVGLSDEFAADAVKQTQWRAFLVKAGGERELDLGEVVAALRAWLWPVLELARRA